MAMNHTDAKVAARIIGRAFTLFTCCSLEVLSRFATTTMGSRSRRLARGAPFQKDIHGIHETFFKRIGPVFPPSANPVAGDEYEHPFHHFCEMQRLLIGANFAALLAFGEESFVLRSEER